MYGRRRRTLERKGAMDARDMKEVKERQSKLNVKEA
jgi:hypothetical protein